MTETETLEPITEEDELLPDEVAELRWAMQGKINEAITLGVFTGTEAQAWEEGFEACDRLEYMQNLVDLVDDFIASGLEIMEQISTVLDTNLLTEREKVDWQMQAELVSFQDKCELLRELTSILRSVACHKQQLMQILRSAPIPPEKSKELVRSFESTDASKKEGIVTRAMMAAAGAKAKNEKVQLQIRMLISGQQFKEARNLLSGTAETLSTTEYIKMVSEIDAAEIAQVRQSTQTA